VETEVERGCENRAMKTCDVKSVNFVATRKLDEKSNSDAWSIGKEERRKFIVMELKCPRGMGGLTRIHRASGSKSFEVVWAREAY